MNCFHYFFDYGGFKMSKYSAKLTWVGYVFNLVADNNQVIATSHGYTSKGACLKGIESVQTNASLAPVEDQTVKNYEIETNPKFEVFTDHEEKYSFRFRAQNGQIVIAGQGYKSKAACMNGIESVRNNAETTDIVEEDIFAEKVIYGNVNTLDKDNTKAEAVAIVDGYIVYIGSADGLKDYIGKETEVLKCENGFVLPGPAAVDKPVDAAALNQCLKENKLSPITLSEKADLVILDKDITACAPEDIAEIKVLKTMVGGNWVNA